MSLGEIAFYLLIIGIIISFLTKIFKDSDSDEYQKKLKKRLDNEFLYDPESGTEFTLEEAEKGIWIQNNNHNKIKTSEELDTYFDGSERIIEEIANSLKKLKLKSIKLDNNQTKILEATQILSKYDDWSYSNAHQICQDKLVLFPEVHIHSKGKGTINFSGYQILFWIKVQNISGHYFLRKKHISEKIFDLIRNDDAFKFEDFEVFTFKSSKNISQILSILKAYKKLKDIEIEIHDNNLFIKTTTEPTLLEFQNLFDVISDVN